jgi:hypothetical protein
LTHGSTKILITQRIFKKAKIIKDQSSNTQEQKKEMHGFKKKQSTV